jgi:hypothetical protein
MARTYFNTKFDSLIISTLMSKEEEIRHSSKYIFHQKTYPKNRVKNYPFSGA